MIITALCFVPGVAIGLMMSPQMSLAVASPGILTGFLMAHSAKSSGRRSINFAGLAIMLLALGLICACRERACIYGPDTRLSGDGGALMTQFIDSIPFAREYSAPLLKAFIAGDRSSLSSEQVEIFRSSGASHLLALSGLHMGIIYMMLSKASIIFGGNPAARRLSSLLTVLTSATFTFVTGLQPSCVRALLFIVINEIARLSCRKISLPYCLSLSLVIQLCISPGNLEKIGFQMSYLAVLGICIIHPALLKSYPGKPGFDPGFKIWSLATLSISCQIFTAPLSWYTFHTFPKYFLLTNLLAMPVMTLLMISAIVTTLLSIAGICPSIMIQATDMFCGLLLNILETISLL